MFFIFYDNWDQFSPEFVFYRIFSLFTDSFPENAVFSGRTLPACLFCPGNLGYFPHFLPGEYTGLWDPEPASGMLPKDTLLYIWVLPKCSASPGGHGIWGV